MVTCAIDLCVEAPVGGASTSDVVVALPEPITEDTDRADEPPQGPRGLNSAGSTPLEVALTKYYDMMPLGVKRRHLQYLRRGIMEFLPGDETIAIGTACSGSDMITICLEVYLQKVQELIGVNKELRHMFVCESNKQKQEFLSSQFEVKNLFGDVALLGRRLGYDLISKHDVLVPSVFIFAAGFSCKSRASCSSKRSANVNCLQRQDAETETSFTFEGVPQYIP